jgi:hypothetical protein
MVYISYSVISINYRLLTVKSYSSLVVSGFQEINSFHAPYLIFIVGLLIFNLV